MAKYHVISCHVLWRELCYFASLSKNVFTFTFLPQGLHNTPDLLRKELQQSIDSVEGDYDALLIGYGLCCNGVEEIKARDKKLVLMRGHDCITYLLGSKERYREYFDAHPGTFWYSPGWIDTNKMPGEDRLRQKMQEYTEKFGKADAEYLMEMENGWMKNYSDATYVDLGFGDPAEFKEYTRKCADFLGWKYDEQVGDPGLVINFLEGNWEHEDFLVVEPGETIFASHDKLIFNAQKTEP
jgi:hypothetical protein